MDDLMLPKEIENKIRLWSLRAIVKFGIPDDFLRRHDGILKSNETTENAKKRLKKQLISLEKKKITGLKNLDKNLEALSKTLNLSDEDKKILEFAILTNEFEALRDVFYDLGRVHIIAFYNILGAILDIPSHIIKKSLHPSSKLRQSRVLKLDTTQNINLGSAFDFFYSYFSTDMLVGHSNVIDVFKSSFFKSDLSLLKFDDFRHIPVDENMIKTHVLSSNKGTNILLYGKPGTGKTEFVKMLSATLGKNLYEISYTNRYSLDNYTGEARFASLLVADRVLDSKHDIIMFDEVEDVFKDEQRISKAFLNNTLENNSVPTFWLTNDIYEIDNAYIRRFDMVIEFKIPPKAKRLEILIQYTNGQISEKVLKQLSKNKFIAPALISNATKVVSNLNSDEKDKIFKDLIKNNLKAQGYRFDKKEKKKKEEKIDLPKSYDASIINSSLNLKELAEGIKSSKNARLCIYGPAGTGKSAYAKFIAKSLGSKIIIKKASDLMDAYVGETEKNIAKAFKEAKDKKAVLVFDEVDTFLQDRNEATRSWEVSQVNEMLTQMESFEGVFIATTNLIDRLDKASIRRFDMKIEFGYLKPKQAQKLFMKECELLGLKVSKFIKDRLLNFSLLTPGDFAAVLRSNKFSPIKDADDFINRLNEEIKHKSIENNGNRVGF
ncbi:MULTISPECIES: ATP-binding protein [unclassified Campylobacter]|uniref:AAA family ATPase n=1 Tax=unclassified Campylobacter TaxID=2593542 RepID=UPI00147290CC|nr:MULTISPECIES: ATP-binding protein [unclassified Campylobacter]